MDRRGARIGVETFLRQMEGVGRPVPERKGESLRRGKPLGDLAKALREENGALYGSIRKY